MSEYCDIAFEVRLDVDAYNRPAVGTLTAPDGSAVHVVVSYAPGVAGCWAVGLMPLACDDGEHEAREIPEWARSVRFERNCDPDYSARMTDRRIMMRVPRDRLAFDGYWCWVDIGKSGEAVRLVLAAVSNPGEVAHMEKGTDVMLMFRPSVPIKDVVRALRAMDGETIRVRYDTLAMFEGDEFATVQLDVYGTSAGFEAVARELCPKGTGYLVGEESDRWGADE